MCNSFAMKIYERIIEKEIEAGLSCVAGSKSSFEVHHGCYLLSKSVVGRWSWTWVGDGFTIMIISYSGADLFYSLKEGIHEEE
jgi:hypothetical protein